MIRGIGVDIAQVHRIAKALEMEGFRERFCTAREIVLGAGKPAAFWAGRWAAKEAFSKALGCGIGADCSFQDVEVVNDAAGAPGLEVVGAARKKLTAMKVGRIWISISHERDFAVATVILEGD